jgi:hypothetical protein
MPVIVPSPGGVVSPCSGFAGLSGVDHVHEDVSPGSVSVAPVARGRVEQPNPASGGRVNGAPMIVAPGAIVAAAVPGTAAASNNAA